jgi:lysozyme
MINQATIALIKRFEGCRLITYRCPAGIPTIGYGHTGNVKMGAVITQEEADLLLLNDLKFFEIHVRNFIQLPLNNNEVGALISFAYNVGLSALRSSTLLRKLNEGDCIGAAGEFSKWDKATVKGIKQPLAGLTARRTAERNLFLTEDK